VLTISGVLLPPHDPATGTFSIKKFSEQFNVLLNHARVKKPRFSMSISSAEDLLKSRAGSMASTASEATRDLAFDEDTRLIRRRESILYPLFSEIAQAMNVPAPVYFLFDCILLVRFVLCSLWVGSTRCWTGDATGVIDALRCVADFGAGGMGESGRLACAIVFIVVAELIWVWHFAIWRYYRTNHLFAHWHLCLSRVIHICLIPLLLPVYAALAGLFLSVCLAGAMSPEGSGKTEAVVLVFLLIATVEVAVLYYAAYGFACNSPVLMYQSLLCSWDPTPAFVMVIVQVWTGFAAPVGDLFEPWLTVVFFLVSIVLTLFCISRVRFFPFQRWIVNPIFVGFAVGNIVCQILTIPAIFDNGLSALVMLPLTIAIIIVSGVLSYFYLARRRRRIVTRLSYSSCEGHGERLSEAEKRRYLETLGFSSDNEAIAHMRVGLAEGCGFFLDFSFPHFLLETQPSKALTFATAEMLCFFPTELRFFGNCIASITQVAFLSNFEHFLLFQMRKIFVLRQSSLSKEAASMIRRVRHAARDGRSAIRSYWVDIVKHPESLNFPSLLEIAKLINHTSGEFRDLADRYANSPDICNEYASFLIEGAGQFIEAFKWKARSQLIEQGIRLDTDFAFRSLMNLYPYFLLRQIFDDQGNYLIARTTEVPMGVESQSSGSFAGMLSSSAGSSNILKDVDLDEVGRGAIHAMSLRLSVGEVIDGMTDLNARFLWRMIAVIHGSSLVIGLVIFICSSTLSSSSDSYMGLLHRMSNLDQYFSLGMLASSISFGDDLWYRSWNRVSQLTNQVGLSSLDGLLVSGDPVGSTWRLSRQARISFLDMLDALVEARETMPLSAAIIVADVRYAGVVQVPLAVTMSGHAVLIEGLDQTAMGVAFSRSKNYIDDDYATHLLGWVRWFEGVVNLARSMQFLSDIRGAVLADGLAIFSGYRSVFSILRFALPIISGICFLGLTVWSLRSFDLGLAFYLNALSSVHPDVIERSLVPIAKGVKREKVNGGSSQVAKGSGWQLKVLPLLIGFAIVANCAAFALAFSITVDSLEQLDWLFSWYELSEQRTTSLIAIPALVAITSSTPHGTEEYRLNLELYGMLLHEGEELERTRTALLIGDEETGLPPLAGFDPELDKNELVDICSTYPTDMHEFMTCMSIDRASSEVAILLRKILISGVPERHCTKPFCNRLPANETDFAVMVVIVDGGLAMQLVEYGEKMLDFAAGRFSSVITGLTIIAVLTILLNAILFATGALLLSSIGNAFESIKTLLRLLPPRDLLADASIVQAITFSISDERDQASAILTPAEIVMERTVDGVVGLTLELIIDSVNGAFRDVTGLSADEAIGQRLSILFPVPEEGSETRPTAPLYERLEQLKTGQTSEPSSVVIQCKNDAGVSLALDILIVPHTDGDGQLLSFSLLLRDLSKQAAEEQQSHEAKGRCERVIQTLMPMEVYAVLSSASTAFSSASATVFSVELTGLFEHVTSYSPLQILEAISAVYDLFDEICSFHPCVRRIRYGGNDILACCGLFDYADQPTEQVEHAALTCLEFASHREEISEKLAMELDITAGISFGGPLLGDVLNREAPRFDLSGPIVSEALEIRQEATPGTVRVTASVQGMLKPYMFDFKAVQVAGRKISGIFEITLKEEAEDPS
jgi:PAS domain S-box-containing protein